MLSCLPFVGNRLPAGSEIGITEHGLVFCSSGLAGNAQAQKDLATTFSNSTLITPAVLASGGQFSVSLVVLPITTPLNISLQARRAKSVVPAVLAASSVTPGTVPLVVERHDPV